jgi:hypothetical protein
MSFVPCSCRAARRLYYLYIIPTIMYSKGVIRRACTFITQAHGHGVLVVCYVAGFLLLRSNIPSSALCETLDTYYSYF